MEISASLTAPNELNYSLSWLIMGQIKKSSYPNKKRQFRPKNHLTVPLNIALGVQDMNIEHVSCVIFYVLINVA
jgi:hypothetical protein